MTSSNTPVDVVIIGGSAAGLAAALQLGRARRSVVVVDSGEPRNAPASAMHAYLGHDGRAPAAFLALARDEIAGYGVRFLRGVVVRTTVVGGDVDEHHGDHDDHAAHPRFTVELGDGSTLDARAVLLASGLVDVLPEIPGVAERWGRDVVHCPYCHGYEVRDRRIVVIGSAMAEHQAQLFRQLSSDVTIALHHQPVIGAAARTRLDARGIDVVEGAVAEVVVDDDEVRAVRLADGTVVSADVVVVAPDVEPRVQPLADLDISTVPSPSGLGDVVPTDELGRTPVGGVYAAGNVADVRKQVAQAAGHGGLVGAAINNDLVEDDIAHALQQSSDDDATAWDRRFAAEGQLFSGEPNVALVAEVSDLASGRALDAACGEGADAIWLAGRGWDVTGVDVSHVAIERAEAAAASADVDVTWLQGSVDAVVPDQGVFDLVALHYAAIRRESGEHSIAAVVDAVAPGGTLLVVGHDVSDPSFALRRSFDPDDYIHPADFAAELDDRWHVEVDEVRPRPLPAGSRHHHAVPDVILRATRRPV